MHWVKHHMSCVSVFYHEIRCPHASFDAFKCVYANKVHFIKWFYTALLWNPFYKTR